MHFHGTTGRYLPISKKLNNRNAGGGRRWGVIPATRERWRRHHLERSSHGQSCGWSDRYVNAKTGLCAGLGANDQYCSVQQTLLDRCGKGLDVFGMVGPVYFLAVETPSERKTSMYAARTGRTIREDSQDKYCFSAAPAIFRSEQAGVA